MGEIFSLDAQLAKRSKSQRAYLEFLRVPAISAGIYVLPAGASDPQSPHREDEIYHVIKGAAKIRLGMDERLVRAGDVIFVEAGLQHYFFDIEQELVLLVVFAPSETN
jgi:mannose-6-phosphate isomerase-like protein (cupin superfamily)